MATTKLTLFANEYKPLYEAFWKKIVEVEFNGSKPKDLRYFSEGLFLRIKKADGRYFVPWFLDNTGTTDKRCFFRTYDTLRRKDKVQFNSLALYDMLVYVGRFHGPHDKLLRDVPEKDLAKFKKYALKKVDEFNTNTLSENDPPASPEHKKKIKKSERLPPKDVLRPVNPETTAEFFKIIESDLREKGYIGKQGEIPIKRQSIQKTSEDQFRKAMQKIVEYYEYDLTKFPGEQSYFDALQSLAKYRINNKSRAENFGFEPAISLQNDMKDYFFDLYELKAGKIHKQRLSFGFIEDPEYDDTFADTNFGFNTLYSYKTSENKIETGRCNVDVDHRMTFLEMSHGKNSVTENICFPHLIGSRETGHKVIFKDMTLHAWMVVIELGPSKSGIITQKQVNSKLGYWVLNKYDKSIPEFTRSLLLAPWEHKLEPYPFLFLPLTLFNAFSLFK